MGPKVPGSATFQEFDEGFRIGSFPLRFPPAYVAPLIGLIAAGALLRTGRRSLGRSSAHPPDMRLLRIFGANVVARAPRQPGELNPSNTHGYPGLHRVAHAHDFFPQPLLNSVPLVFFVCHNYCNAAQSCPVRFSKFSLAFSAPYSAS